MTEPDPMLLRLMTWLSPAFPIGAFAYSGGLEAASHGTVLNDADTLQEWLETALTSGPLRNDAILLNATMGEEDTDENLSHLALAMANSPERYEEQRDLGESFWRAAAPWMPPPENKPAPLAYPVAVGALARHHGMHKMSVLQAFLHATLVNQIQAGQRLLPVGQQSAMAMLEKLEAQIIEQAHAIATCTLDNLGSAAFIMDHDALNHATLPSRIFRS